MNPYERRIIHSALQNDKYVETYSEGEEPYRRVVINIKKTLRDSKYSNNKPSSSYRKDYKDGNKEGGKSYHKPYNNSSKYNKNYSTDYKKDYEKYKESKEKKEQPVQTI